MIYKLQLSTKETISISQEEFEKFKANISANFIEFKNGIVNPSFVVCAVIDREATAQEMKELRWAEEKKQLPEPEATPEQITEVNRIKKEISEKYKKV